MTTVSARDCIDQERRNILIGESNLQPSMVLVLLLSHYNVAEEVVTPVPLGGVYIVDELMK